MVKKKPKIHDANDAACLKEMLATIYRILIHGFTLFVMN